LEETFPLMVNESKKYDPIRKKYFDPIEKIEKSQKFFFWMSVFLSFTIPLLDKNSCPSVYSNIQILFCLTVFLLFSLNMLIRFYLKPRADDMRLKDFVSHGYGIALNHDQTKNYYNNNETNPRRKIAAQLLENSMHSKSTASVMAVRTRWATLAYVVIFIIVIINRSTDLEWISIAAQVIVGEYILLSWVRAEWTLNRYERVFDDIHSLFLLNPENKRFEIKLIDGLIKYETTKPNSVAILSNTIFESNNDKTSQDWENLKSTLNIL